MSETATAPGVEETAAPEKKTGPVSSKKFMKFSILNISHHVHPSAHPSCDFH